MERRTNKEIAMHLRNQHSHRLARRLVPMLVLSLASIAASASAQFGGSTIVFDPAMFSRQLQQLQQETATVMNLAQQLQYAIKNTSGGGAGLWQSNQGFLNNLGGLISEQQGLSYTLQNVGQEFQTLYPGYQVTNTPSVQSTQSSFQTTLNTLNGALASAQAQAQNFQAEQTTLGQLELRNQTAVGNLQAVQVSNELALAQVQQIQMLRQLLMAQMNSQNVATANQMNAQVQSSLAAQAIKSAPYAPDSFQSPSPPPLQPHP
jgi:P-type conjugative transfer protein TrbJ